MTIYSKVTKIFCLVDELCKEYDTIVDKLMKSKLSKHGSKMDKIDFFMNPEIVKLIIITSMYQEEVE